MHGYTVYGLRLDSEFPIPELQTSDDERAADVSVRRGAVVAKPPEDPEVKTWVESRDRGRSLVCAFEAAGRFEVRNGREIVVEAPSCGDPALVRHALIGPVLAHLLWQRDIYTLHASVLRVRGRHVAFVGESGEGKSTTAAALAAAGHALVCDDIAAIPWQQRPVRVLPAFARIRLYPDALRGMGGDPDQHPLVHSLIDKRLTAVPQFVSEAVPLECVYVLETAPDFQCEPLERSAALMLLMKHAYSVHNLAPILGFGRHMKMAASVAAHVPVCRLGRPKDLNRLPELVRFVEAQQGQPRGLP